MPTRVKFRRAPNELQDVQRPDPSAVAPACNHNTVAFSSRAAAQRARAFEHHPGPTSKRQLLGSARCRSGTNVSMVLPTLAAEKESPPRDELVMNEPMRSAGNLLADTEVCVVHPKKRA